MNEESTEQYIERAIKSKQPRFGNREATKYWIDALYRWSKDMLIEVQDRATDNRERDAWLRDFWKQEPLWAGVLNSINGIDKNRGWTVIGGRNQVNRVTSIMRNAEDSAGWRRFASLNSQGFWATDLGSVTELGRRGVNGPLSQIWNVDPTRCRLTGNVRRPLIYRPVNGKDQLWRPQDFFRCVSMPDTDERMHQLGYCATSRALDLALIMVSIYRHDREMLFSAVQKGILLFKGIDEQWWKDAMETHEETMTRREREFFGGLSILFGDSDMDAKLIALSQLPEGFNLREWTGVLMNGYALVAGFDPREFWPVSGGTLGTGQETEVQAMKATSKGALDWALAFQDNMQRELPPTIQFEFEQRNEQGQLIEAEIAEAYGRAINEMSASPIPGTETLTRDERRFLYATRGLIPEEWTEPEEPSVSTDTDSERRRWLDFDRVRRAAETFPDEPLVQYSWPAGITRYLWNRGEEALQRRSFPVSEVKSCEHDHGLPEYFIQTIARQNADGNLTIPLPLPGDEDRDIILADYAAAIGDLILAFQRGEITREQFEADLLALVETQGLDMFLTTSELALDELDDEQLAIIEGFVNINRDSIAPLAGEIEEGKYDDDLAGLATRAFLWVNTLAGLGSVGMLVGHPEQNYVFNLGGTIDHCGDCLRLSGQVHPGSAWHASGLYPQSHNLECNGYNCLCYFTETTAPESGGF